MEKELSYSLGEKIRTSDDCVSREQALLALTGKNLSFMNTEELIVLFDKRIKALPPVTPTQSTCKDCKHNRPNSYARTMFSCERGNRFKLRDCEDFYCADFEKRGNENG